MNGLPTKISKELAKLNERMLAAIVDKQTLAAFGAPILLAAPSPKPTSKTGGLGGFVPTKPELHRSDAVPGLLQAAGRHGTGHHGPRWDPRRHLRLHRPVILRRQGKVGQARPPHQDRHHLCHCRPTARRCHPDDRSRCHPLRRLTTTWWGRPDIVFARRQTPPPGG